MREVFSKWTRGASLIVVGAMLAACGGDKSAPSGTTMAQSEPTSASSASEVPTGEPSATATATATASASDSASAAKAAEIAKPIGPDDPEYDPKNKAKPPLDSDDLQIRGKALFDAIVHDDSSLGEDLWFPREPFLILKDIKDPGKYWDHLHRAFKKDVTKLHKKRKSWEGCEFVKLQLGSAPKWVEPGDEGNKIGYFRTVKGNLIYKLEEKEHKLEVRVMISWQKRWYITHLGKFK